MEITTSNICATVERKTPLGFEWTWKISNKLKHWKREWKIIYRKKSSSNKMKLITKEKTKDKPFKFPSKLSLHNWTLEIDS